MSIDNVQCEGCSIRSASLFAEVPDSSLNKVEFKPTVTKHKPGEVIVREASEDDSVYTIREGVVKLERPVRGGSRRIVRLMKRGDTLGLHAWKEGRHPHRVVALNEVELCRIPHHVIEAVREDSVALNENLIERFHEDCQLADKWITEFSSGSVIKRVAQLLIYLSEIQGTRETGRVSLLSREDMAAALGVRQESISRTLSQFKGEGLLRQIDRGNYEVDDEGLSRVAVK